MICAKQRLRLVLQITGYYLVSRDSSNCHAPDWDSSRPSKLGDISVDTGEFFHLMK